MRTEMVGRTMAAISLADPSFALAGQRDVFVGPARLSSERTSTALLAIKAMTDRHADRLAFAIRAELATLARSRSYFHLISVI